MKHVISMCLIALCTATGISQSSIDALFSKYSKDENVTKLNFSGSFLNNFIDDEPKFKGSEINGFRMLIFEEGHSMTNTDQNVVIADLVANKYEELMHIRSKDGDVDFYVKDTNDYITDLVMLVESDDHHVLLELDGKIHYDVFDDLDIDFEGSHHLKQVKRRN